MPNHPDPPRLFFKVFLLIYGGFLLAHVLETGFDSWQLLVVLLVSMTVAFAAHKHHGFLPSALLAGHMLIEWYSHAVHGNHYSRSEIIFHGIHAVLDIVFLCVEARVHYAKYALPILGALTTALVSIFAFNYTPEQPSFAISPLSAHLAEIQKAVGKGHSHSRGILHHVVIGGMLGCVLWSLLFAQEQKHAQKY